MRVHARVVHVIALDATLKVDDDIRAILALDRFILTRKVDQFRIGNRMRCEVVN